MPDAGVLATILLIVGLFLLALELMIPSFGMIGIMSAITLLISAWSAWQAWWPANPGYFWTYAGFWVLGIPSVLGGMLFLLENTTLGDRIVLRGPGQSSGDSATAAQGRLASLVGQTGQAASLLTPGGMVNVGGERFHAESPGMPIESGCPVLVTAARGNRLVVRAISEKSPVENTAQSNVSSPGEPAATVVVGTPDVDPDHQSSDGTEQQDVDVTKGGQDADGGSPLDFEIPENYTGDG
ncbi:MAG: NfeD family protein [Fuerstiella sp.]|nr:NfeD family protein [Fuerstiella sp.]